MTMESKPKHVLSVTLKLILSKESYISDVNFDVNQFEWIKNIFYGREFLNKLLASYSILYVLSINVYL